MMSNHDTMALRLALVPVAFIVLVVSVLGGLARLSPMVAAPQSAIVNHGVLLGLGFFGTLIALVRIVVLRKKWAIAAPLINAIGAVAIIFAAPRSVAATLMMIGAVITGVVIFLIARTSRQRFAHEQMLAGTVAWFCAAFSWLIGADDAITIAFLAAFLVLSIAGERTQLGRLNFAKSTGKTTRFLLTILGVALVITVIDPDLGSRLLGGVWLLYAVWLLRSDARKRRRKRGQLTFMSNVVYGAVVWLAISGGLWIMRGAAVHGFLADAAIHALMLGFVFMMVFGHAPMVLAAVMQLSAPFHPIFYSHVVLLHAALVLRITGDLAGNAQLLRVGAIASAGALLVFIVLTAASLSIGLRRQKLRKSSAAAQ